MKKTISIDIECGETTCASEPGQFCHLLRLKLNGRGVCYLYGEVEDKDGWLMRHPRCLEMSP